MAREVLARRELRAMKMLRFVCRWRDMMLLRCFAGLMMPPGFWLPAAADCYMLIADDGFFRRRLRLAYSFYASEPTPPLMPRCRRHARQPRHAAAAAFTSMPPKATPP